MEWYSGTIVVAATTVVDINTTVAALVFSERGKPAGEIGGGGWDDGWDIVDMLVIEWCTVQ